VPPPARDKVRRAIVPLLAALALAGCGGSSSPTTLAPRTPPDLEAFLRLPVATPSTCPSDVRGTTSGRRSPWVGHVDVSVFVASSATPAVTRRLRRELRSLDPVQAVYFESRRRAYAEFQRLYTCSADVPRRAVPASYRLVLAPVTQPVRDDLVRTIRGLAGVGSVSCDPSNPCVVAAGAGRSER
jgi:hypothetical protein